jgi:hypothetical protein
MSEGFGGAAMANAFTIDSCSSVTITVRHVAHGHRYVFGVKKSRTGIPTLRGRFVQANKVASLPAVLFRAKARVFAMREARKAGLID